MQRESGLRLALLVITVTVGTVALSMMSCAFVLEIRDSLPNGYRIVRDSSESIGICDANGVHVVGADWSTEGSITRWRTEASIVLGETKNGFSFQLDTASGKLDLRRRSNRHE